MIITETTLTLLVIEGSDSNGLIQVIAAQRRAGGAHAPSLPQAAPQAIGSVSAQAHLRSSVSFLSFKTASRPVIYAGDSGSVHRGRQPVWPLPATGLAGRIPGQTCGAP